jgi:N-acetylneuraminic acid mutarotase
MIKIKFILIFLLGLMFFYSCKKYNEVEKITIRTGLVSAITPTKAFAQGAITNITDVKITEHGHCWSSANDVPDFRINQGKTLLGAKNSDGSFSSNITGLFPGTRYYVRSFFIAKSDTFYGNDIQVFRTLDSVGNFPPNVSTGADSAVTITTAKIRGTIVSIGTTAVTAYGHCYSSSIQIPTLANTVINLGAAAGPLNYMSNLSGLTATTTYYCRAFATNSLGTSYGNVVSFTTSSVANTTPSVITKDSFAFPSWTANVTLLGNLVSIGNTNISELGHLFTSDITNPILTVANTPKYLNTTVTTPNDYSVSFSGANINSLTTYRYRAFATNTAGTAYGNEFNATTGFKEISSNVIPDNGSIMGFARGVSAMYNGEFYYGQGYNPNIPDSMFGRWYKYVPGSFAGFTQLASCPIAMSYSNCFVYNNKIYVVGGKINNNTYSGSRIMSYNPASDTWATVLTFPNCFWGGYGFLLGDKYYVVGGFNSITPVSVSYVETLLSRTLVYNITTNTTSTVADVPGGAKGFGAAFTLNGDGYIVGGLKNQANPTAISECWQYNVATNLWTPKANLPSTQGLTGVALNLAEAYGNFGYAWSGVGGTGGSTYYKDIYRFNPISNSWKLMHIFPDEECVKSGVGNFYNRTIVYGAGQITNVAGAQNVYSARLFNFY